MIKELYQGFKKEAEAVGSNVYHVQDADQALVLITELLGKWETDRKPQGLEVVWQRGPIMADARGFIEIKGKVHEENLPHFSKEADVGITEVDLAIAETGTLAQDATDVVKRYVTTLPELNILLLKADKLVSSMEEAFAVMKPSETPFLAFITGPSRTADIERVLTLGVHGPEWLWIIFVGGEGA